MAHTILIVDDNPDEIEITKRILSKTAREVRVETAFRGEAALELLRNGKNLPEMILLDLKMPGMGGIDALQRIRADERVRHIPVIIVTNSSLESDEKDAYAAGADNFIRKSFDLDQFGRDMESVLKHWLRDE